MSAEQLQKEKALGWAVPILVLPTLAKEVGLNEAIFLQQLHYWLNGKGVKVRDGRRWLASTYEDWQEQFPFWNISTIKRIIRSLAKQGLLLKGNYNETAFDRTIWYAIDYETLERLELG